MTEKKQHKELFLNTQRICISLCQDYGVAVCWLAVDFDRSMVRRFSDWLASTHPTQIKYCWVTLYMQAVNKPRESWPWRTWDLFDKYQGKEVTQMGSHKNGFKKESFILSVDIGTTSIKCHVYDKAANIRGSCTTKVLISRCSNYTTNTQRSLCNNCLKHVQGFWCWYSIQFLFLFYSILFLQVIPLYPKVGYVEMNPDAIWKGFISVAKRAVQGMVAFPSFFTYKKSKFILFFFLQG